MSNYLTAVDQATDKWVCRLVDDPNRIDPEDGSTALQVCEQPYEKFPDNIIKTGEVDWQNVYLSPFALDQGSTVGKWNNDGTYEVEPDPLYAQLVVVGNDEGKATSAIGYPTYQGHKLRHQQETVGLPEYPAGNQPFTLRITRTLTLDDDFPTTPWGWTVEVFSEDPARDITARAIGIYDEEGNYLYTTGAFVLTDFEDGVDEEGNPIIVQRYATVCPVGQRLAEAAPVYFKLLLGSAPEGAWVLDDLEEGAEQQRLFWAGDKPTAPGNGKWVTAAAITDGMAGTTCLVSPDNSEFAIDSKIRIDGAEYNIDSLWTTGGLNLTPYVAIPTGFAIEIWQ